MNCAEQNAPDADATGTPATSHVAPCAGAPVAVVDVGSNTLKVLVAAARLPLLPLADAHEDTRLSPRHDEPPDRLSPRAIRDGTDAIARLLAFARAHAAERIRIVATSAVRDAANGTDLRDAVHAKTGHTLEILDGTDEARGIAAGVATDPALAGIPALRIVDIGGGSLEYIFRDATGVRLAESHPLGAARLTRRFITDPTAPIPASELETLAQHVRDTLTRPMRDGTGDPAAPLVGCGGVFTVCRAIFAAGRGQDFEQSPPLLSVPEMRQLRDRLAALPQQERVKTPALPPTRADIYPAALTTLLVVAELAAVSQFTHTRRSLRHGIAAAMVA
ncbi:MAG: hypothetical protein LBV28_03210 [Puniceicoccales bacterium]|jgi:exopolyphosphatase/guanosine-5'-triphosphate,3'-diphosphate pyrophosphatase|nr:hypothetical protein [Puniceicoccales bacterium]